MNRSKLVDPTTRERGLTETSRGGNQCEFAAYTFVEEGEKPRTPQEGRLRQWSVEFGGEDWRGHRKIIGHIQQSYEHAANRGQTASVDQLPGHPGSISLPAP